jgi:hypothetical protein
MVREEGELVSQEVLGRKKDGRKLFVRAGDVRESRERSNAGDE